MRSAERERRRHSQEDESDGDGPGAEAANRSRKSGRVSVYDWHKLFSPRNSSGEYSAEGKTTLNGSERLPHCAIGCYRVQGKMADHLIEWIAPVRERRLEYEKHRSACSK